MANAGVNEVALEKAVKEAAKMGVSRGEATQTIRIVSAYLDAVRMSAAVRLANSDTSCREMGFDEIDEIVKVVTDK